MCCTIVFIVINNTKDVCVLTGLFTHASRTPCSSSCPSRLQRFWCRWLWPQCRHALQLITVENICSLKYFVPCSHDHTVRMLVAVNTVLSNMQQKKKR